MEKAGHSFFVKEMPGFLNDCSTRKVKKKKSSFFDETGREVPTSGEMTPMVALINFRNEYSHTSIPSQGEFDYNFSMLKGLLKDMDWCRNYPMYKRIDEKTFKMMGVDVSSPEQIPFRWDSTSSLVMFGSELSARLPLMPFFLAPREFMRDPVEDLLVYDSNTGKRFVYTSPKATGVVKLDAPMKIWREMIAKKKTRLPRLDHATLDTNEIKRRCASVSKNTREGLRQAGKVIKDIYFERIEIEEDLQQWGCSSYPLEAVWSPAGRGKTCLLDHMSSHWEKEGNPTLFLRAQQLSKSLEYTLRELLVLEDEVMPSDLASACGSKQKPFIIIIDGVNESSDSEGLLESILQTARKVGKSGLLKILFPART